MATPQITALPEAPKKTDAPETFSQKADNFLGALDSFGSEINVSADFVNTRAIDADNSAVFSDQRANDSSAAAAEAEASLLRLDESEANAKASELAAAASETNALISEQKALTSEQNAATSEANAKASELSAAADEAAVAANTADVQATQNEIETFVGQKEVELTDFVNTNKAEIEADRVEVQNNTDTVLLETQGVIQAINEYIGGFTNVYATFQDAVDRGFEGLVEGDAVLVVKDENQNNLRSIYRFVEADNQTLEMDFTTQQYATSDRTKSELQFLKLDKFQFVDAPITSTDITNANVFALDTDFLYVAVAENQWKRITLEAF